MSEPIEFFSLGRYLVFVVLKTANYQKSSAILLRNYRANFYAFFAFLPLKISVRASAALSSAVLIACV